MIFVTGRVVVSGVGSWGGLLSRLVLLMGGTSEWSGLIVRRRIG